MVHGVNLFGHGKVYYPMNNNTIINNFYGQGGMPPMFGGRYPYGYNYSMYGYNNMQSDNILGKLLLGLGLGYAFSKINDSPKLAKLGSGNSSVQSGGEGTGLWSRIKNWFSGIFKSNKNENNGNNGSISNSGSNVSTSAGNSAALEANPTITNSELTPSNSTVSTNAKDANNNGERYFNVAFTGTRMSYSVYDAMTKMDTSHTSKALADAVLDANDVLAQLTEDIEDKTKEFNDSEFSTYASDDYAAKIDNQKESVKQAKDNVKTLEKDFKILDANLTKASIDCDQAEQKMNSYKDIYGENSQQYIDAKNDYVTKRERLESIKSNYQNKKQELDDANNVLALNTDILKEMQGNREKGLAAKKEIDDAIKEKELLNSEISKNLTYLENLSKSENKKVERLKKKAAKKEARSQKYADRGWTRFSQIANNRQTKIQERYIDIENNHFEFSSNANNEPEVDLEDDSYFSTQIDDDEIEE